MENGFDNPFMISLDSQIVTSRKTRSPRKRVNKNERSTGLLTIRELSQSSIIKESDDIIFYEQKSEEKKESQFKTISKSRLGDDEKYAIVEYMKTQNDCITFCFVSKSCKKIISEFSYNPVPITNLYPFYNITSLIRYSSTDPIINTQQIERIICTYPVSYSEAEELINSGMECTRIKLSKDDVELNGITIPEEVDVIGENCFSECFNLRFVPFPPSVHQIERFAFSRCSSLTTVIIPSSITNIGEGCFNECCQLERLFLSSNLTIIGNDCFSGCSKLSFIKVEDESKKFFGSVPYWIAQLIEIENNIHCVNVEFTSYDRKIKDEIIPTTLKTLGEFCFSNSLNTSIIIPTNISKIKGSCFSNCSKLKLLLIPNTVVDLAYSSFFNCSSLTSITISNSLKELKDSTFSHCSSLVNVTLPSSLTKIDSRCFSYCTSLKSIELPLNVVQIGDQCFSHCSSLHQVIISDSITKLGTECFMSCNLLENVFLPNIQLIPISCFENCSKLLAITIPKASKLSSKCFKNCIELQAVVCDYINIPIKWEESSFEGCSKINKETLTNLKINYLEQHKTQKKKK
ncbi:hypothetical protein, conserved [Entamoeba dispar SAW760]|uniref:Leucine rich repeat containing protein BspA family protein n=1 Tax=Entamoeba dispar (strain ATCC PRA-260 / SAW760) TaxID=370354 RepID=B0ECS7_ENTDS|nr:uncharacterized protein EDI_277900 [Entamoeba dispar SAW760]EDR27619.1 hypothetical protein, conserved [Entamoeba dispar SAW760]|eukprot:EDR27619.1 hypothetical protein, conserved [Entamoeba dispar SAW760]